ncbi:MAG: hypothetical protein M3N97_15090 [Pseudomonadota bacterium]|nr:hypothetical protein [Pseudomonadota bacterium]
MSLSEVGAALALPCFASHPGSGVDCFDLRSVFAPLAGAAERFLGAARRYLEDSSRGAASASTPGDAAQYAAEAARTFGAFLREESIVFFEPFWNSGFAAGPDEGGAAPAFDLPAFGLTREHQQRWQRTAEAGRRIADAQRRLQLLWSDALRDAATAFAARLAIPQPAMGGEALRHLYDSWIDCAEEAYRRTAHGDSFCSALADLVNASSQWRAEVQASIEHGAKPFDLPTRSELDALNHRLRSVEAQLHAERNSHVPRTAQVKPRTAGAKSRAARPEPQAAQVETGAPQGKPRTAPVKPRTARAKPPRHANRPSKS